MSDQGNGARAAAERSTGAQQVGDDPIRLNVELSGSAQTVTGDLRGTAQQPAQAESPALAAGPEAAVAAVQQLDTVAEQRAAAEGVVQAIPSEAKQNLAATVVQGLDTPQQQQAAAERVVQALPTEQREQLTDNLLGAPDRKTRQRLWYLIIGALTAAIFVFGMMAFILIYQQKAAEAPLALATTALGGIVGLIATSPGSQRST
jgi:hypothetical protein